jgi:hypothetical protein
MSCLLFFLVGLVALTAMGGVAPSSDTAKPVQISGALLSFSGNTLDVKQARRSG